MPTINKPFLLKLVLVVAVIAGVLAGVHTVQARRIPDALRRQADRAADAGKLDMAVHYLRQYLEFNPDDAEALEKLVELLRRRSPSARGLSELVLLYDRILRIDPDRQSARRDALALCLRLGRYSDAVTHAEALLKTAPADADLWQQLGAAQTGLNQLADARKSYEAALTHAPGEMIGYQRLAQLVWRNLNDPAGAMAVLDRMVAALPLDAQAYLVRAKFEAFLADEAARNNTAVVNLDRAVRDLHRVLELDPENADASLLLAEILQRGRDVPAAHAVLRDAVALYPRDLRVIRALAWLELVRGNVPAAVAVLEDGLKATPDGFDLLVPLADLLVQQGDTARTADILKRLEARKAPAVQVKYLQARVAMRGAKWPEAVALLEALRGETAKLPGLETQLNLLLATCHEKTADTDAEEKALRRVTNADPGNVPARMGLATLYLNQGKFDDAGRELEAAAASPFASGAVHAELVRLKTRRLRQAGGSADDWRKIEQAVATAAKAFGPVSSEPVILLAEVNAAQGRLADAVKLLRQETARRPGDTRLWAVLAELSAEAGGSAAGLAVVDEAQAAAGDGPDLRLARATLYAREPGRVRPIGPLVERIDTWPEADQLRLLYGLVEIHDELGDRAGVLVALKRVAARRPADLTVWMRLRERAVALGDEPTAKEARDAVARIEGEGGPSVVVCDALAAKRGDAGKLIEALVAKHGANPSRADACLALAKLRAAVGDGVAARQLTERAFVLEPTRFEPTRAWLVLLCRTDEVAAGKFVTRLASDPRWGGEPFRRVVGGLIAELPPEAARKLVTSCRPLVEKEPGGLGWLAGCLRMAGGPQDEVEALYAAATRAPNATADDWLRLAVFRAETGRDGGAVLLTAKPKLPAPAFFAAAAAFRETDPGRGWSFEVADPADRRIDAQARLAVKLSRSERGEAMKVLEAYLVGPDLPPADAGWARRNLAMLYAVGGTPEDRRKAMKLLSEATAGGQTPDELRATASVLTTLSRYLEGQDRIAVLTYAANALSLAHKATNSPRDLFNLAQLHRAAGKRKESRDCLQVLLNADGNNIYYLTTALEELTEAGDFTTGAAFADRLRQLYPGEFRAVAAVARFECKAGRPERALALAEGYARAADLAAGDHLTRSARVAELLDELVRLPGVRGTPAGKQMADAAVERYAALVPSRPEAVVAISGLLAADGRTPEAFARIDQYDRYLTKRTRALAGLAAARAGSPTDRQLTAVKAWLDDCLAEDRGSAAMRLNLAEYFTLVHKHREAATEYEAVLKGDPRNVVALNNLAWLLAADPAGTDRALELLDRATREIGLTGELLDTRARVEITRKQFAKAKQDLDEAMGQEPTPLRYFHVAVLKLAESPAKTDEAAKAFREARARGLDPKAVHPADLPTFRVLDAGNPPGK